MLSFGAPDLPGEQSHFNHPDHTWTMLEPLESDLDIFGFPSFDCKFKILNDTQGTVIAKLCDVFPNGESRLISYGSLNLTQHKSEQSPEALVQGKE